MVRNRPSAQPIVLVVADDVRVGRALALELDELGIGAVVTSRREAVACIKAAEPCLLVCAGAALADDTVGWAASLPLSVPVVLLSMHPQAALGDHFSFSAYLVAARGIAGAPRIAELARRHARATLLDPEEEEITAVMDAGRGTPRSDAPTVVAPRPKRRARNLLGLGLAVITVAAVGAWFAPEALHWAASSAVLSPFVAGLAVDGRPPEGAAAPAPSGGGGAAPREPTPRQGNNVEQ